MGPLSPQLPPLAGEQVSLGSCAQASHFQGCVPHTPRVLSLDHDDSSVPGRLLSRALALPCCLGPGWTGRELGGQEGGRGSRNEALLTAVQTRQSLQTAGRAGGRSRSEWTLGGDCDCGSPVRAGTSIVQAYFLFLAVPWR